MKINGRMYNGYNCTETVITKFDTEFVILPNEICTCPAMYQIERCSGWKYQKKFILRLRYKAPGADPVPVYFGMSQPQL